MSSEYDDMMQEQAERFEAQIAALKAENERLRCELSKRDKALDVALRMDFDCDDCKAKTQNRSCFESMETCLSAKRAFAMREAGK